jgi:hypothetical protein
MSFVGIEFVLAMVAIPPLVGILVYRGARKRSTILTRLENRKRPNNLASPDAQTGVTALNGGPARVPWGSYSGTERSPI